MPSIPAIQIKTIKDKAYCDFIDDLTDLNIEDIEKLNGIKYPKLYDYVKTKYTIIYYIYVLFHLSSARLKALRLFSKIFIFYISPAFRLINDKH